MAAKKRLDNHSPIKLPSNEAVVELVDVGGDEGSSPIDFDAHRLEIRFGFRREELKPMKWFGEGGNLFRAESQLFHYLPLETRSA